MRPASASTLTSPNVDDAAPPVRRMASTRLSTPPQDASVSPATLCSLATPVGSTSETTTVTPAAARARAVELPMPTGLPHPVTSATRAELGIGFPPFDQIAATLPVPQYSSSAGLCNVQNRQPKGSEGAMTRIAAAAAVVLLAMLAAGGAIAEGKSDSALPPRAVTHHTIVLGNRRIDYDAIAEALPLTD